MVSKSIVVAVAGATAAQAVCTFPYNLQLSGNAVFKPDATVYPTIGVPFDVSYNGLGLGPVLTFALLRGPGNNIVEVGDIAVNIPNCGTASCTWSWTPDSSLEPDTTHYGIKMIDQSSCNYQYTTQFGLNAGSGPKPSSLAPPKPSGSAPPSKASSAVVHPAQPSEYVSAKPSSYAPKPSAHPEEDCEDDKPAPVKPSAAPVAPVAPVAPWVPSTGTWKASNGTAYTNSTGGATPSYTPLQSNDAGRFAISAFGAIVAFAAAIMVV